MMFLPVIPEIMFKAAYLRSLHKSDYKLLFSSKGNGYLFDRSKPYAFLFFFLYSEDKCKRCLKGSVKAVCRLHHTFDEQEVRSLASGRTMGKQRSIG